MSAAGLADALARLARGETLDREGARAAMDVVMNGAATPAQIGAFLMALRLRGETAEEIAGAADSLRAHALITRTARRPLVDTCGTGGDGAGTFNISTAAAFVVVGAGVAVAKHGNRSVSSRAGSADVLEAMGARIDLPPEGAAACLEATGFGFFFAPVHHGAVRHAAAVRKELGLRTLFNVLGPLANPAGATHQLLGVYDPRLTETVARVLGLLGIEGALVVHGDGGLDEISISGPTKISELKCGEVRTYAVGPETFGVAAAPVSALRGGDPGENAARILDLFAGAGGPAADAVCANAGAALYVAGHVPGWKEGFEVARGVLADGRARRTVDAFVDFSRQWSG